MPLIDEARLFENQIATLWCNHQGRVITIRKRMALKLTRDRAPPQPGAA
jgi:hypothetical protein